MRRLTASSGQSGIVQWWWYGGRHNPGKGGFLVYLRQIVVRGSRCQLHLLVSDPVTDSWLRVLLRLQATRHKSSGQPWRPSWPSSPKAGL
jgi:hypothetical protein